MRATQGGRGDDKGFAGVASRRGGDGGHSPGQRSLPDEAPQLACTWPLHLPTAAAWALSPCFLLRAVTKPGATLAIHHAPVLMEQLSPFLRPSIAPVGASRPRRAPAAACHRGPPACWVRWRASATSACWQVCVCFGPEGGGLEAQGRGVCWGGVMAGQPVCALGGAGRARTLRAISVHLARRCGHAPQASSPLVRSSSRAEHVAARC